MNISLIDMSVAEVAIVAILAAWWVLSCVNQIRPVSNRIGRFDPLALLPRWTFFAPNPGIHDNHLVYGVLPHGSRGSELTPLATDWKSCEHLDRTHIPLLWNPQRRVSKSIADINNCLITMNRDLGISERVMPLTSEYLAATNIVASRVTDASYFQWALVRSHGFAGNRTFVLSYLSHVHRANVLR